jgi:hypothetical protein
MKQTFISGAHPSATAWIHLTLLLFCLCVVQGCGAPPVIRGMTVPEADAYLVSVAGTSKPDAVTLAPFYYEEEKYVSWTSAWDCNNRRVRVLVYSIVITPLDGNLVKVSISSVGDCTDRSRFDGSFVGRYDSNSLYLYKTDLPSDYTATIKKFDFEKSKNNDKTPRLIYRGSFAYYDDVWKLQKAKDNPLYGVTGQKIAESGNFADMWSSTEWIPQTTDPRPTALQRQRLTAKVESESVDETAGDIARRRADRTADERSQSKAMTAAALGALSSSLSTYAAERAKSQAKASAGISNLLADVPGAGAGRSAPPQAAPRIIAQAAAPVAPSPASGPTYKAPQVEIQPTRATCPAGYSPAKQANGLPVTVQATAYCVLDAQSAGGSNDSQRNGGGSSTRATNGAATKDVSPSGSASGGDSSESKKAEKVLFRKTPIDPPAGSAPDGLQTKNGDYSCKAVNEYSKQYSKDIRSLFDQAMYTKYGSEARCQTRCDLLSWREELIKTFHYTGSWICSVASVDAWNAADAGGNYNTYKNGNNSDNCMCVNSNGTPITFSPTPTANAK